MNHTDQGQQRPVVRPEPINLSNLGNLDKNAPSQEAFLPHLSPAPDVFHSSPAQENSGAAAYEEAVAYEEAPADEEAGIDEEMPVDVEETSADENHADHEGASAASPAELLAEYADCRSRLIPAGTGVDELNRKYLNTLRYGMDWGFCTVIMPVSSALAERLCFDEHGNRIGMEDVRARRGERIAALADIPDASALQAVYRRKTGIIAGKGISIDDFESTEHPGVAVNCFSSFVKDRATTCDLLLLQIPVSHPWQVFAWLPVGGVGGMPSDTALLCASKHWYELCGVVPAVLDCGVLEYFVPNGKPSPDSAMQIAREQFALCHERVLRLTHSRTLGELADTLTRSCIWYLGWK